MSKCIFEPFSIAFLAVLLVATAARAVPTTVVGVDSATCDPLSVPLSVEEIGTAVGFPVGHRITAGSVFINNTSACALTDGGTDNRQMRITNLTSLTFAEVWYVADTETSITNVDGLVNGGQAFRIDKVGVNQPLLSESITANGLFEPGEQWEFLLQDYTNPLRSGAAMGSQGVGTGSTANTNSSGSIIAIVPEPGTALLFGAGLLALAAGRGGRTGYGRPA